MGTCHQCGATFAEAVQHPDIENYLDDLRQKYPVEVAQDLLESIWAQSPQPSADIPATLAPGRERSSWVYSPPGCTCPAVDTSVPGRLTRNWLSGRPLGYGFVAWLGNVKVPFRPEKRCTSNTG